MASNRSTAGMEGAVLQGVEGVSEELPDALSDPYARYVLRYLHEQRTAKLEELVDVVFGAEVAGSDTIATPANREPVRFSLRNRVLPQLDDVDYVEFDADERTVARADVPQEVFSAMGIDE